MFENLSKNVIDVCKISKKEAKNLRHSLVGIDELLLGLLSQDTSVACKILNGFGITLNDARKAINKMSIPDSNYIKGDTIQFSSTVKNILKIGGEKAKLYGLESLETQLLLLILLDHLLNSDATCYIFNKLMIDVEKLKILTLHELNLDPNYRITNNKDSFVSSTSKLNKKKSVFSFEKYTTNLNEEAIKGNLDPIVGRKTQIKHVIQILARRRKNNAILTGEAGVGKTAIAEGLAQLIIKGEIPTFLSSKKIISLNLGTLLADTKYRGSFESRLNRILIKVKNSPNIILFIDEIHNLVGAGASEGSADAANLMKPALARGEFQCIGATTTDEYKTYIAKDPALERRFQPVHIPESTINETIQILRGLKSKYEKHHGIEISDKACTAAAELSAQYIFNRFLPDKAIDILDEACSFVRLKQENISKIINVEDKALNSILTKKNLAITEQRFLDAFHFRGKEIEMRAGVEAILRVKDQMDGTNNALIYNNTLKVKKSDVEKIVTVLTGIPVGKISTNEKNKLLKLESVLGEQVIGQKNAIDEVAKAIRRSRVGLKNTNRPIASFLFVGSTGVGKTELSKALAKFMLNSEDSMIRFDMSEYMEKINISKLIGSPPGYIGYEEGGILTEKISQNPYTLILFDEIEKAHSDIFNLLLQILDEGRLTDSKGSLVNFKNTLIILTSNAGAKSIDNCFLAANNDFNNHSERTDEIHEKMIMEVHESLKSFFKPEFLNRLDDIIIFEPLNQSNAGKIMDVLIDKLITQVLPLGINLTITNDVKNKLSHVGFQPFYGARPLRRAITTHLEDSLTNILLDKKFISGTNVLVSLDEKGKIIFTVTGVIPRKKNIFNKVINNNNFEKKNKKISRNVLPNKLITSDNLMDKNRARLIELLKNKNNGTNQIK